MKPFARYRRQQAEERAVPPFVVFNDATLRELARIRPTTEAALRQIHGIGEKKLAEYGFDLLQEITNYCHEHGLAADVDQQPANSARSVAKA